MRILYLVHQFYPENYTGTEKFVFNMASMLQKAGHHAKVVTYSFAENKYFSENGNVLVRDYVYNSVPVLGIKHKCLPLDSNTSFENTDIYRFAANFLKKDNRYDFIHIGHPMRIVSFAKAAMKSGIPYIITLTDYWTICPKIILQTSSGDLCVGPKGGENCLRLCPEFSQEFIKSHLSSGKNILKNARAVVSPSRFLAAVIKTEYPELDLTVIPHGMDYRHLEENRKVYKKGDKLVLGFCGSLIPHKGVHVLLKAFRDLEPSKAELRLYGSSFQENSFSNYLKKLARGQKNIRFCGNYKAEEVGGILKNIDVMVVPSLWYENYPLVIHEAFACNIPVIASNIGGMAEKVKNSTTGLTFHVGDDEDLAGKLKLILQDPRVLNEMKARIRGSSPPFLEEEAYMYERLYRARIPSNKY
jgi:glycosyltransferase involved in cell wall biosynthesis